MRWGLRDLYRRRPGHVGAASLIDGLPSIAMPSRYAFSQPNKHRQQSGPHAMIDFGARRGAHIWHNVGP